MSLASRDGYISGVSLCGRALVVKNWRGVYVCAAASFTPSFQLIVQRYWLWNEADAKSLLDTLDDEEVRRVLRVVPRESVGSGHLPQDAGRNLRNRTVERLIQNDIKLYRFDESDFSEMNHPQATLLVDMRRASAINAWNAPNASIQDIREAITCELSILLAQRGLNKDIWDRKLREEPWYNAMGIYTGAALTGAGDFVKSMADAAVFVIEAGFTMQIAAVKGAAKGLKISEEALKGNFDAIQRMAREQGVELKRGIDDARKLIEQGAAAFRVLWNDPVIGKLLLQYLVAYAIATPRSEMTRNTIPVAADVLITLALTIATAEAGGAGGAAYAARAFGAFSGRLIQLLARAHRLLTKAASKAAQAAEEARLLRRHPPRHELPHDRKPDAPEIPKTPPPGMARFEPPCFQPGSKIPTGKYPEYDRQLKGQETGLNEMTVQEYLDGRDRFAEFGRIGKNEQAGARAKYEADLRKQFADELRSQGARAAEATEQAAAMAKDRMQTLAALHNPDQIVGGGRAVNDFGDRQVNSSIGSHWKSRVGAMDEAAKAIPSELRGTAKMHIKLERCK